MKKLIVTMLIGCAASPFAHAIDLKQSKFTQVVNDVEIISTAQKTRKAAAVDDLFRVPDVVRTGPASRAELIAEDRTITRIGANTVFSFDEANRTIHLEKGSLLFNSPKGKGGGTIRTGAAAASVLGTTIVVSATPNGGFKVLTLEGTAEVRFQKGPRQRLNAGQMTFVLPGSKPGPVIAFRLDQQTENSRLVTGFKQPLPSQPLIKNAVNDQLKQIQSGKAKDTGMLVGDEATEKQVEIIDLFNQTAGNADPNAIPGLTDENGNTLTPQNGGFLTSDGYFFKTANEGPAAYAQGPALATFSDADINSATLDPNHLFTDRQVVITIPSRGSSDSISRLNPFAGFYARNITFNTASVNLAPYNALPFFDFVATRNLSILSSLTVPGFSSGIYFSAGRQIIIPAGTSINVASDFLFFGSIESMSFDSVQIKNDSGPLEIRSDAGIALNNVNLAGDLVFVNSGGQLTLSGGQSSVMANNNIALNSGNGLTVGGGSCSVASSSGEINLVNSQGLLTVNNGTTLSASFIGINSPNGGVLIDSANLSGSRLDVAAGEFAGQAATLRNLNLVSFAIVNIAAHTLILTDVNFKAGSVVTLKSLLGQLAANPNSDAVVKSGYVNFVHGVTYGGQAAQNYIGNGINIRPIH